MFFYTIYKSKIWIDLEPKRRNIRILSMAVLCYVFFYSYLTSKYMSNQQLANTLKKILYSIILLDVSMSGYSIFIGQQNNKSNKKNKTNKNNNKIQYQQQLLPHEPYHMIQYTSNGLPNGLPNGLHKELPNGLPNGLPKELPNGLPNGLPKELPKNLSKGLLNGLPKDLSTKPPIINESENQLDDIESELTKNIFIKSEDNTTTSIPMYKCIKDDNNDNDIPIYKYNNTNKDNITSEIPLYKS